MKIKLSDHFTYGRLLRFTLPSVVMMVIASIYSVVDGLFVSNLVGDMSSQGTTPRRLTDLIGSLCDLTSGSGDKGTPVILVQGYFDNFTD